MLIHDLETPVGVIDLDRLEANIAKLKKYCVEHQIDNRPHIKTHRIPEIAQMQVKAGAVGITCQKIREAEIMADAGLKDIFLPYNIVGESKLKRLVELAQRVRLSVTADSEFTVSGLSQACHNAGIKLSVLVEFDTGYGRCGAQTPEDAWILARLIDKSPSLKFGGLMCHPYNDQSDPFIEKTKALLEKDGIPVERVSYGGTSGVWQAHTQKHVTEYRAGVYIYGDRYVLRAGAMKPEDCSLKIITTIVSRPTADRGIMDGGSKAFTSDLLGFKDYGMILEYPEAVFYNFSEEHGWVDFSKCGKKPQIGERLTLIPNHCCVISNLFNEMVGVRRDKVEVVWKVAARGASQ